AALGYGKEFSGPILAGAFLWLTVKVAAFSPVFSSVRSWAGRRPCCSRKKRRAICSSAKRARPVTSQRTQPTICAVRSKTWRRSGKPVRPISTNAERPSSTARAPAWMRLSKKARAVRSKRARISRARARSSKTLDIKVNVREAPGDCYVVDLSGEIDVYTSPKVKDAIGELIDRGVYHLVINLEKVRYIDSTGLGVLIGGLKRVREHGGSVNLVCTNPQIKKIFDITGLVKIFGIFENEDSAMKALV